MKPQYNKLVIVALLLALIALFLPEAIETPTYPITYINASYIDHTGVDSYCAPPCFDNITTLNDINGAYWGAKETTSPFNIDITFTNITNFSYVELKAIYTSSTGTPSSHIVDFEIWCESETDWVDLFDLSNHNEWQYFTRRFPDVEHFIDNTGNVTIRLNHTANGNQQHRINITTARLILSQTFVQNTINLTQNFNTTTSGGGASNLSQLSIDTNKSWLGYNIYNVTIDNQSISNKVNKTGDNMTGNYSITGFVNISNGDPTLGGYIVNFSDNTGNTRSWITSGGIQSWKFTASGIERGYIGYALPGNQPNICFFDTAFNTTNKSCFGVRRISDNAFRISMGNATIAERNNFIVFMNGTIQLPQWAGSSKTYVCQENGFFSMGSPGC